MECGLFDVFYFLMDVLNVLMGYDELVDLFDIVFVVDFFLFVCDGGFIVFEYNEDFDEVCKLWDEGCGIIVGM